MAKKQWNYFDLTLEECRQVLNTIEGLVVIDSKRRIRYISPDLADELDELYGGSWPRQLTGEKIDAIHPCLLNTSDAADE